MTDFSKQDVHTVKLSDDAHYAPAYRKRLLLRNLSKQMWRIIDLCSFLCNHKAKNKNYCTTKLKNQWFSFTGNRKVFDFPLFCFTFWYSKHNYVITMSCIASYVSSGFVFKGNCARKISFRKQCTSVWKWLSIVIWILKWLKQMVNFKVVIMSVNITTCLGFSQITHCAIST